MNHQYKITLLLLWVLIHGSCASLKTTQTYNQEFSQAKQTAQKELSATLEKIPNGTETQYGFNSRDEFQSAEIGNPFNYYGFNGSTLEKSKTVTIPIIVADEFRALASVDYITDTLHIVDFGATELAREIQKVQKENASLTFVGLLRVYQIRSDFVIMAKSNEYIFFPLTSATMYLQSSGLSKAEKHYTQSQIAEIIKSAPNE